MAVIISVVLFAITVAINPRSLNMAALGSILLLTLVLSFASAGQTIVLIGGGLDFTVGAVMSSAAILTTYVMNGQDGRFLLVFALAIGMGIGVGLLNGICSVKIDLPPMIVTMAISNVVTRMQYVLTQGSPGGYAGPKFVGSVINKIWGFIPSLTLYALLLVPLVFFLLNKSRFGKQLYMMGNNPTAAHLTGVKTDKIRILMYVFSAVLSAFAGMLGAAYMGTARCQIFDEYAFNSLVAVIVGGTAFTGGIGSFAGSIAGALLMIVLSNGLTVLALSQPVRNIVQGVVLLLLLIVYNRERAVRQ
ncbi:MAG: ABC transporter permease [Anaerolineae bacterium]|nr:ABC transporter permease [Anaerolineae bacterium]